MVFISLASLFYDQGKVRHPEVTDFYKVVQQMTQVSMQALDMWDSAEVNLFASLSKVFMHSGTTQIPPCYVTMAWLILDLKMMLQPKMKAMTGCHLLISLFGYVDIGILCLWERRQIQDLHVN